MVKASYSDSNTCEGSNLLSVKIIGMWHGCSVNFFDACSLNFTSSIKNFACTPQCNMENFHVFLTRVCSLKYLRCL